MNEKEQTERLEMVKMGLELAGLWPGEDWKPTFPDQQVYDCIIESAEAITDIRLLHTFMWVGASLFAMEASGFDVDG